LDNVNLGNETYLHVDASEAEIVEQSRLDMLRFRLIPDKKEEKLALLYQTPKFHKNPPKMRFIAGNVNTITLKLDSYVAMILKMCKTHFKNYFRRSHSLLFPLKIGIRIRNSSIIKCL